MGVNLVGQILRPLGRACKSPRVEAFPFSTEVRVRFAETDAQGIANNSVYLVWFELARVEYLERFAGGYPGLRARGVEALVTEVHVRYGAPARFDDRLRLRARCRDVRGARFRFEYRLDRAGELVADGSTAHACVDARTFRPIRVPEWLAEAIVRAEASLSGEPPGSPEPPPPVR
jgi:acyl-CoA thioester hydrolase